MRSENKRDLYLKVRVSQEEMDAIKKKFQNSGMDTLSGFIRAMIFEGYIVQMDGNELKKLSKLANNIANNINQIAARVNSIYNIYKEDIEELKRLANQLWRPLLFLQNKVMQLKHGLKMKIAVKRNFDSDNSNMGFCTGFAFENTAPCIRIVTIIPQSWTLEV